MIANFSDDTRTVDEAQEQSTENDAAAQEMKKWLEAFLDDDQLVELRGLEANVSGRDYLVTLTGVFDREHIDDLIAEALYMTEGCKGVYLTLNPRKPDVSAPYLNEVGISQKEQTTKDCDILCRQWILIDIDPERKGGVSATDGEKELAVNLADKVFADLKGRGWPDPVVGDSGNGRHLLYRVDLPADDGGLVERVLKALAGMFNSDGAKIDTSVFNPARIFRLYYTWARKGENSEERPHRQSCVESVPDKIEVVPEEMLRSLAESYVIPSLPPKPAIRMDEPVGAAGSDIIRRARAYLKKVPGAVSGEGGHNRTFHAACTLVQGFNLSDEDALPLFAEWNLTCVPPWDERDLVRKLSEARKKEGVRGHLLNAKRNENGEEAASEAEQSPNGLATVKGEAKQASNDPHRLAKLFLVQRFQHETGCRLRYWKSVWWRWHDGSYSQFSGDSLRAEVWSFLETEIKRMNQKKRFMKASQDLVSNIYGALGGLTKVDDRLDQSVLLNGAHGEHHEYLAVKNGILDIEAVLNYDGNSMQEQSVNWFSQVCLPYEYDPSSDCPIWRAFLKSNLEGDTDRIDLLQEYFGYCLTSDTRMQKFLLMEGDGSNGKSVVCAALTAMLGKDNVTHVSLENFGGRFALHQTLGKLASIASEIGDIDKIAEGILKGFTSGDRMTFDRKGIAPIEAVPTAKLVFSTNNRPRFNDRSNGIWRRLLLMPFLPVR